MVRKEQIFFSTVALVDDATCKIFNEFSRLELGNANDLFEEEDENKNLEISFSYFQIEFSTFFLLPKFSDWSKVKLFFRRSVFLKVQIFNETFFNLFRIFLGANVCIFCPPLKRCFSRTV